MLFYMFHQVGEIFLTVEYFSFPELNIFLKIISGGFRNGKVFHGFRNLYPHFFTHPEIMINGIPRGKNNRRIVQDVYSFLPEFFSR